jgi:dTDP-4-amino-4,6-dideoxygalactose transaminase
MPVHTFGNPVDMNPLTEIAQNHNLQIIEDAACAHGSEYDNKKVGRFGKIACFSFHARKVISTGEGGIIVTDNDEVYNTCLELRSHGMKVEAHKRQGLTLPAFSTLGFNYRMSDINASIGRVQLARLDDFIDHRKKLARLYKELLNEYVIPQKSLPNTKQNYQSYVVLLKKKGIRNQIINQLHTKGIGCTIGTYSLSNLPLFEGNAPISQDIFENTLSLPMFHELNEDGVKKVCEEVNKLL